MSKVSKRQIEDLLARWPETQAKLLAAGASERDALAAFMPLKALMHDKGIWEAQKFDTAELLDGILAVSRVFFWILNTATISRIKTTNILIDRIMSRTRKLASIASFIYASLFPSDLGALRLLLIKK